MTDDTGTARLEILLRCVDEQVLAAAAKQRKQSLCQFVREVLELAAVDLRQGPVVRVSWLDVYSRHADTVPDDTDDDGMRWTEPRPARLSAGPTPKPR